MTWSIKEEIQKRCDEDPEFKEAWEEKKRLQKEFEKAAKPLVEFLQNNCFYTKAIVDCAGAELLERNMISKFDILENYEGVGIK